MAKPGAVTDGHRFIPMAFEKGATLALVEREVLDEQGVPYPSVQVPDVVLAMGDLARYSIEQIRAQGELTVIGITGSAGKTTTRTFLPPFSPRRADRAPVGSYNSEVGVPLTVFGQMSPPATWSLRWARITWVTSSTWRILRIPTTAQS